MLSSQPRMVSKSQCNPMYALKAGVAHLEYGVEKVVIFDIDLHHGRKLMDSSDFRNLAEHCYQEMVHKLLLGRSMRSHTGFD